MDAVKQDSASLATRLEGLEKDLEALKEANAQETALLNAELARTNEVRSKLLLKGTPVTFPCPLCPDSTGRPHQLKRRTDCALRCLFALRADNEACVMLLLYTWLVRRSHSTKAGVLSHSRTCSMSSVGL